MNASYETRFPLDVEKLSSETKTGFGMHAAESFYPASSYAFVMDPTTLVPLEYTDWRDETESWHRTCSLCTQLSPSPVTTISGPDAINFMRENFPNNVDKWDIGASKHGLMLLEDGTIAAQGVVMRSGEQEYKAYWMSPFIDYRFSQKDWDATCTTTLDKVFVFQMQGPKSLAILEEACGCDLHDIAFLHSKEVKIADCGVRVLRFGMGNTLGYEVHGDMADAPKVHKRILEVGSPHGIRRMGLVAYHMNHTTGGSQQAGKHFGLSMFCDPGYAAFAAEHGGIFDFASGFIMEGSFDGSPSDMFANPIEIGLRNVINWNHDFIGRDALLEMRDNPRRNLKTLVWNADDIADIYRSQFTDEPFRPIDDGGYLPGPNGMMKSANDWVLDKEGNKIGFSGGRQTDWWNKAMISLAVMDIDFCEEGTEVQVLWGEPGTRQKLIRATVAPVPYNTHLENRTFDVNA